MCIRDRATFDEDPDLSTSGPQDQVSVGQIIETEDGKEKVIAVDGQGEMCIRDRYCICRRECDRQKRHPD